MKAAEKGRELRLRVAANTNGHLIPGYAGQLEDVATGEIVVIKRFTTVAVADDFVKAHALLPDDTLLELWVTEIVVVGHEGPGA